MPSRPANNLRIQSLIGKGGMSEVYRALDTKLDRQVAIKVFTLPIR
jgi:serine/threonine protein kinase